MKNRIIISMIVLLAVFNIAIDFVSAEHVNDMLKRAKETNDLKICSEVGRSWYAPCVTNILENGTVKDISFCSTTADDFIKSYCEKNFYFYTTNYLRKEIYIPDVVIKDEGNGYQKYIQACLYSLDESEDCLLRLAIKTNSRRVCESIPPSEEEFIYFGFNTGHKKACELYFNPFFNISNLVVLYFAAAGLLLIIVFALYFLFKEHLKRPVTKDIISGLIFQLIIMLIIIIPWRSGSTFSPGYRGFIDGFTMDDYQRYIQDNPVFFIFWALGMWWYLLFAIFAFFKYLWRKKKWLFFVSLILFILITMARIFLGIASFQN